MNTVIDKSFIVKAYSQIVEVEGRLPSYSDFIKNHGISRSHIQTNFGNLTKLHEYVETEYSNILSDNLAHENNLFGKKRMKQLDTDLKKSKRFFITTAVTNKRVFEPFYQSIKHYCELNNAMLLILGCSDVGSSLSKEKPWTFDRLLKNENFIGKETRLNSKLFISDIKLSAKHINPTTGLSRIGQRNGSYVFASPKQFLETIATSSAKDSSSMAMMTTGAITIPDYSTDKYMSERTSYIAENDHVMGGIIVEINGPKEFHFRQVQANSKGEFIDFGVRYKPDGTISAESANLVLGDWHAGTVDKKMKKVLEQLAESIVIDNIFVHDLFDGKSINHHEINSPMKRAMLAEQDKISLSKELDVVAEDLTFINSLGVGDVVVVRSNHDEFLDRYIEEMKYREDPINMRSGLELSLAYLDEQNVLRIALDSRLDSDTKLDIVWLERDEDYKIAGIELGAHGDLGSNGSSGSLLSLEKAFGQAVVGHAHSAAILRGVWRVGITGNLDHGYNRGPSSWTNSHCLVYKDGSRQLINVINWRFRLWS